MPFSGGERWLGGFREFVREPDRGPAGRRLLFLAVFLIAASVGGWWLLSDRGAPGQNNNLRMLVKERTQDRYGLRPEAEEKIKELRRGLETVSVASAEEAYWAGRGWELVGEGERAEEAYRDSIGRDSGFGPSHYRLGLLLFLRAHLNLLWGTPEERAAAGQEMMRLLDPAREQMQVLLGGPRDFVDPRERVVAEMVTAADLESTKRIYRRAVEEGGECRGMEEVHLVFSLLRAGPESTEPLDRAIAIAPCFPEAYQVRALLHAKNQRWEETLADCEAGIRGSPRYANLYVLRGQFRRVRHDEVGAAEDFRRALDLFPPDASIRPVLERNLRELRGS